MKHRLVLISCASLLLGIVFDWFFYDHNLGLNFFLYTALILAVTAGLMHYWRRRLSRPVLGVSLVALLFSAATFTRANGFVQFLDMLCVLYLLVLIGLLLWRPQRRLRDFTGLDYLQRTVQLPLLSLAALGNVLRRAASFNVRSEQAAKRNMLPVVRGILLSLPILGIFVLLFASADLVFKQYVSSVFNFQVSPELVGHTVLILAVAACFIGVYSLVFTRAPVEDPAASPTQAPRLGSIEATIILGSVTVLFLLFVIVQLQYLFGGQSNITVSGGYTYAEYARKGFFELIAVAMITFLLMLALHGFTSRQTPRQQVLFTGLCFVLVLAVGLVMYSAHHRLSLYEQAYGFTELRLYSHLFIGWLVVAIGLLLAYIARSQPQKLFARGIFIASLSFIAVINLINPDAFVARQNIERFRDTGKLDVAYLGSLSADATPALSELLADKNKRVQQSVAAELYAQQQAADETDQSWLAFHLSQHRAQQIRQRHQAQLEANGLDNQGLQAEAYSN